MQKHLSSSKIIQMVDKKQLKWFPFLIIFFEVIVYLSNDMYLPSMPTIATDLDLSQHQIQATLTFWFLGASLFQLFLGPISDRYGRRKVLIVGCMFFVLSSIACAIASTLTFMLIARFAQGTAICSLVAATAAVHELYSTKKAIQLLAWIGAITILAPALGPLFGAMITQFAHWRYIFWLLAGLGILCSCGLLLRMPESLKRHHPLHFATIMRDYGAILRNKYFLFPTLAYFFLAAIYFLWIFTSPFITIEVYNRTPLYYGIAQTIIFSCFFLGAVITKQLLDRYNLASLLNVSAGITIVGTLLLAACAALYPYLELAIFCMMLISFGSSMLFGPLNRIAIEACKQPMGRITAVFSTSSSLSGVASGWVLSQVDSGSMLSISILMLACMLLVTWLILLTKIPKSVKV